MQPDFWHQRWQSNQIGFHASAPNPMLVEHVPALKLRPGSRVFVPLCGKTLDLGWLIAQGHRVAGAELSEVAVRQLFEELGVSPRVTETRSPAGQAVQHFASEAIDIFVGDVFHLTAELLGEVDAVYDRAALVALPADMRRRYAAHLRAITGGASQLLLCFAYDQQKRGGPPFSIDEAEVREHYADHFAVTRLASQPIEGGLKGCPATEQVWMLTPDPVSSDQAAERQADR